MHEFVNNLCQSLPNLTHNHGLHQGVAPPQLTLPTAGEREQVGTCKSAQAENVAMHLCVCLITLI